MTTTTLQARYAPAGVVQAVILTLEAQGLTVACEPGQETVATLCAARLLMALDVEPAIDPDDDSPAAQIIRDTLLEGRTGSGRSRRLV